MTRAGFRDAAKDALVVVLFVACLIAAGLTDVR